MDWDNCGGSANNVVYWVLYIFVFTDQAPLNALCTIAKIDTGLFQYNPCAGGKNLFNCEEMLHEVGSISCRKYDLIITVVMEYDIHTSVENSK